MVYIHKKAYQDLESIFTGMLNWSKAELSVALVEQYIDDIITQCYDLDSETYHFPSPYPEHKKHGKYIHRYRRNKHTVWYIIYDLDTTGNILVNKIISNHKTYV